MLKRLVKERPLLVYFVLAYLLSWMFLIPGFMALLNAGWSQDGLDTIPPLALIGMIGVFGPTVAAIVMTRMSGNKVSQLFRKMVIWKVSVKWYLFALFVPSILLGVSVLISQIFSVPLGKTVTANLPGTIISSILLTIPFGPLPEEPGWRGYALPRLLERYNPLIASLILGFFWTCWHIPAFFVPGVAIPSAFEVNALTIFLYLLNNTALCLVFTAIYLRTRGSVLLAILLHAGSNASANIVYYVFPGLESDGPHRIIIFTLNIILTSAIGLLMLRKRQ